MCKLKLEVNQCYNLDCKVGMQLMKEQGIKADWCITDPPYGIGVGTMTYTNGVAIAGKAAATRRDYTCKDNLWDNERIGKEFFDLIFELSGNQILFGGNYYTDVLPVTKSWVASTIEDRNNLSVLESSDNPMKAFCIRGKGNGFTTDQLILPVRFIERRD